MKLKKILNNYLICAVLTGILLLICKEFYDVLLISPDDISYRNVISGFFTSEPNAYAYFIKYPLGKVLSFLYTLSINIAWYEIFLLGCNALCVYLILLRLFEKIGPYRWLTKLISIVLLYTISINNLVNLEWTVTAGLLSATAIFFYISRENNGKKIDEFVNIAICLILFLIGFNLRSTVALMYLPLIVVLLIVNIFFQYKIKKRPLITQRIHFISIGILIVGILLTLGINAVAYHNIDWDNYKEYTAYRSTLVDYYGYPDYDTNKDTYDSIGISKAAYEIMKDDYNFIFLNDEFNNYDFEKLAGFSRNLQTELTLGDKISKTVDRIYSVLSARQVIDISILIIALLIYNLFNKRRRLLNVVFAIIVIFWSCGLYGYLGFSGRLPVRVAVSISYGILGILLGALCLSTKKTKSSNTIEKVCTWLTELLILCLVIFGSVNSLVKLHSQNETDALNATARYELIEECNQNPEDVYFLDFNSFTQYGERVGAGLGISSGNCINAGGWTYNTPFYQEFLKKYDINSITKAIKENGNIYFMVDSDRSSDVSNRLNNYFETIDSSISIELADQFMLSNGKSVDSLHFTYDNNSGGNDE